MVRNPCNHRVFRCCSRKRTTRPFQRATAVIPSILVSYYLSIHLSLHCRRPPEYYPANKQSIFITKSKVPYRKGHIETHHAMLCQDVFLVWVSVPRGGTLLPLFDSELSVSVLLLFYTILGITPVLFHMTIRSYEFDPFITLRHGVSYSFI